MASRLYPTWPCGHIRGSYERRCERCRAAHPPDTRIRERTAELSIDDWRRAAFSEGVTG